MKRVAALVIGVLLAVGGEGVATAQVSGPGAAVSGVVVTEGGVPVANACVYALQATDGPDSNPLVGYAITGADGSYAIDTIPVDTDIVIGFSPPFSGPDGPCTTPNGPPPVPAPGALQAVWYRNVFLDLSSPQLEVDPYGFALQAGATTVRAGASGIDACLTSAPAAIVPRPSCSPTPTPQPTPASEVLIAPQFTG
jgi:hypothetical protein